jgi:hypothetical protein
VNEQRQAHGININKSVLADFTDVKAGKVRRNAGGRDIRQAGGTRSQNGQMGGKMRRYEEVGLARRRPDDVWELTELGQAEYERVAAEYAAAAPRPAA